MKIRILILVQTIFLVSCMQTSPPEYMIHPKGVRLFSLNTNKSAMLTDEEAKALIIEFDGRLFTNGRSISDEEKGEKRHVISVAYQYYSANVIAYDSTGYKAPKIDKGYEENHLDVYSDGTVGYLRTLKTYEIYPMKRYSEKAILLGKKHGLISDTDILEQKDIPNR